MDAEAYLKSKRILDDNGIVMAYSGYLSENVLASLGETLRHRLVADATDWVSIKRVFSLFVEQTQNIIRYSAERLESPDGCATDIGNGMVAVGYSDGAIFVLCGNTIDGATVPDITSRLDYLRQLDREGLKRVYKQKLREPAEPASKGGSLGLVEIARRSSRPLEYGISWCSDEQAFFCIKAFVEDGRPAAAVAEA